MTRDFWRAPLRRVRMRTAFGAAVVIGVLAVAGASGIASADASGPGTAIAYGSTWSYTSSEVASGWMNPGFDASSWATDTAPFSDRTPVYCAESFSEAGLPTTANTDFPVDGTIYLRNTFFLPADAWGLHLAGTIDNNASMWVNGSSYGTASGGECSTGDISVDVPSSALQRGASDSNLVAVQASDNGTATYFALQATYGAIAFGNQPAETAQNDPITDGTDPIRVTITPPAGGAAVPNGTEVDLTLQTISGTGTLSGGTASTSGGVATFPALAVSAPGEYRLVAKSGGATVTSSAFIVADQITDCPAGQTCTSTGGSTADTQVTASSSFTSDPQLAVSVIGDGAAIPPGVCGAFVPLGAGSFINILGGVVGGGNITATWTLNKSLVKQAGNPGAAHFNICLGAENLEGGTTPWTTKDGSPATPVYDADLGATLYWGLLPDCPKHGSSTGPCILHRNKTGAGNEVVSFYLPYPWDAGFHGG